MELLIFESFAYIQTWYYFKEVSDLAGEMLMPNYLAVYYGKCPEWQKWVFSQNHYMLDLNWVSMNESLECIKLLDSVIPRGLWKCYAKRIALKFKV